MKVPFYDHRRETEQLSGDIGEAIERVLASGEYQEGKEVREFEKEIADFHGSSYAIATGSCFDALFRSLLALGIGEGDEVITVSNTDIACSTVIHHTGADVRFVDINEETYNMDPAALREAVSEKTECILVVHMYGHPAEMDEIMDIVRENGLSVIEDAALAQGAEYKGEYAGTIGDIGCFSHAPSKMLGNIGDGGSAVTNDPELARRIRELFIYESPGDDYINIGDQKIHKGFNFENEGYHGRMVEISAAVLQVKLNHLEKFIEERRKIARLYDQKLNNLELITPYEAGSVSHSYRNYTVRASDRDRVRRELAKEGVETGMHYTPPLHLQPVYSDLSYEEGSLPVTEETSAELFTLPMYPQLTEAEIEYIVSTLGEVI
ncbi:DegT/DnrJ/EryC1/StrS family aminotransferase [Candidatus Bipolaricaulota bacterium]|nr:DegT/DnrJ/EryC1/StrS family aminotransferase [Candidatus Bipolaricaulota bacterium]